MTMNPDEKTTLFGKGPSRSKRGFFSLSTKKFVRIGDDKFQGKEDTIQHTLHAADEISTASSEYTMESFLPHEKFHSERKKIQWKENPIIEEEDDEEEAKTQSNHVSRGVTFAVNDDTNKHEDNISPKVRSYSAFEKAKSMRVTVSNFGKNFVSHLFGSETEEEKKRQMRMSKFILVVDDAFHEDEDEEEQASAAMETAKQGLLAELIEEVKAAESALWFLWKFPENKTQDPNTYLQGATEVIALTVALSWILTIIFNPSVIANNPLLDRLGYNNVCVGWDTFPANIVGVVGTSIGVHLGLRFIHLNASRTKLLGDKLSERSKTYGLISSNAFALALVMMPIIFAVPPTVSVYAHSLPFLFFIVASAAVLLGRFIMFQDELSQTRAIYIAIFSFVSFVYPVALLCEYRYYDVYGEKSPWPGMLTMTIDYSWFALLSLMPIMLPKDIVLLRDHKLGYRPKQF